MSYIFRWKESFCNDDGSPIEVKPSKHATKDEVWAWAIKRLRPAGMTDDETAERLIRSKGEVVKVGDSH